MKRHEKSRNALKVENWGAESSDGCGLIGSDTDTVDSLDAVLPLLNPM